MMEKYIEPMKEVLTDSILYKASIKGELFIDELDEKDYKDLRRFCQKTGFEFKDYDLVDKVKFAEIAMTIKEMKDNINKTIEESVLSFYIDDFLKNHHTCTLITGYGDSVRGTPIGYIYMDESLYIFSKGGEKFLNILYNPNVSVCIYNTYKNIGELAGMQIRGEAEIIEIGSEEYLSVLKYADLDYENIVELVVELNLIKVNISKIEFLWAGFSKLGYGTKQVLYKNK